MSAVGFSCVVPDSRWLRHRPDRSVQPVTVLDVCDGQVLFCDEITGRTGSDSLLSFRVCSTERHLLAGPDPRPPVEARVIGTGPLLLFAVAVLALVVGVPVADFAGLLNLGA